MNGDTARTPWSERRQVITIMVLAAAGIGLIAYFLLLPMNRSKHRLEKQIEDMTRKLTSQNYGGDERTLLARKSAEERRNLGLRRDLETVMSRMAAFPDQRDLARMPISHIDFKVALLATSARLHPYPLGMDDAVDSDEDPRTLMLQLRAVDKVVTLTLDVRIADIERAEPLPPIEYRAGSRHDVYTEEYPVFVVFTAPVNGLYQFLQHLLDEDAACLVRRVRVRKIPGRRDQIRVEAVVSALLFPRTLDEIAWPVIVRESQLMNLGGR